MTNRTRSRTAKVPPGATAIRIPRQHRRGFGRRSAQPIVLVVPEQPSFASRIAWALGSALWEHRKSWVPTGIAVLALPVTAIGHAAFWWAGLALAPLAAVPPGWLVWARLHRPDVDHRVRRWRRGLAMLATAAATWTALALLFGPVSGPLGLLWLLTTAAGQALWLRSRRTSADPIEEI
ncbi:hypothetical protein ACGFRG_08680 [Streptomyces sp. NPDC048696]|uniref:hypothetical protein n=1 Tax=Streptomyces sp. NPDC048696 TaxID=3365585 RepID=UPI00371A1EA7